MSNNLPNVKGVGKVPSSQTLYWPYGVWSDGAHLWIADTGNRRVLFYETIPTKNYTASDQVIGKKYFEEKDYDSQHAIWPYSVKVSADGMLAITDTRYYRILIWKHWKDPFLKTGDVIIGQPDLDSCGQNKYKGLPQANTLNWCYDTCMKDGSMWIADTGNSRVLFFKNIPTENNRPADGLYGNISFDAIGEHLDVGKEDSQLIYWPFAVNITDDQLIVADTGNHRIIFYKL